jgi:hypothetical protein
LSLTQSHPAIILNSHTTLPSSSLLSSAFSCPALIPAIHTTPRPKRARTNSSYTRCNPRAPAPRHTMSNVTHANGLPSPLGTDKASSTSSPPRVVLSGKTGRILCVADIRGDCECSSVSGSRDPRGVTGSDRSIIIHPPRLIVANKHGTRRPGERSLGGKRFQ